MHKIKMPSTNNIKHGIVSFSAKIRPLSPVSGYTENAIKCYLEIRVLTWCTSTVSLRTWGWILDLSVGFLFRFSLCKKWGSRHRTRQNLAFPFSVARYNSMLSQSLHCIDIKEQLRFRTAFIPLPTGQYASEQVWTNGQSRSGAEF